MTPSLSTLPQPVYQPIPGSYLCRLALPYVIRLPWTGKWLGVRVGYETDGASLPRATWTAEDATPFDPNCAILGATHDPLYEAQLFDDQFGDDSRHQADKELYHIMLLNGPIASAKARTFFIAVDDFGGADWDAHTPDTITAGRKFAALFDTETDAVAFANQPADPPPAPTP